MTIYISIVATIFLAVFVAGEIKGAINRKKFRKFKDELIKGLNELEAEYKAQKEKKNEDR